MSASWSGDTHWPPISSIAPSMTSVHSRPPTRSRASSTATDRPAFFSSFAAVVPAAPAPMITTSLVISVILTPSSGWRSVPELVEGPSVLGLDASTGSATRVSADQPRRALRPGLYRSGRGEGGGDHVDALVQQRVRDRQRREEADDVSVGAAGQDDHTLRDARLRHRAGERGIGLPRLVDELGGDHRTVAT